MTEYFSLGEITKADRRDDGTVEFKAAKAAGPDVDLDQQILDPEWLKTAMPAWMQSGGNLREQHLPTSAAGIATNLVSEEDGSHYIDGLVVDPGTAKKVDLGVLKGLSVGIKGPQVVKDASAPGGRVVGGTIVEVSLVDRPCNPTCKMVLAKTAGAELVDVEDPEVEQLEPEVEVKAVRPEIPEDRWAVITAAADKHSLPDIAKAPEGDWTHDPALLSQVRDGLASLMQAELDELKAGESELWDLQSLLCALSEFLCWWNNEAAEGEDPTPEAVSQEDDMTPITLGAVADLVKSAASDDATEEDRNTVADIAKMLGVTTAEDLQKALDTANDKTKADIAELTKALEARLAQVEEMAAPGGPARMGAPTDQAKAATTERAAQAAYYRQQAEATQNRDMRLGYLEKAAELEATP